MALKDFPDSIAVITGGASGIGLATAKALYAAGAHVVLAAGKRPPSSHVVGTTAGLQEFTPIEVPMNRRRNVHFSVPVWLPTVFRAMALVKACVPLSPMTKV